MRRIRDTEGSSVVDVVIAAAVLIFVVLPLFSYVSEKYIISAKARIIKDAVDMSNVSLYNAMTAGSLGRVSVDFDSSRILDIYKTFLAANMDLDGDLEPEARSVAEEKVGIDSLEVFTGGFPVTCPDGLAINRPSVHSHIIVPVKPSLYRQTILALLGRDYIELDVHVDSEIPLNN